MVGFIVRETDMFLSRQYLEKYTEMIAPGKVTNLPTIFSKYKLDEVYNADEFWLFFCVCKSLNLRSEGCIWGKTE